MGSPPDEPERRPDEAQVEVTLTKGFWMGKYEVTQGQWQRLVGKLPGELTAAVGEGDDIPLYNVNYAEAEAFCRKLTELGRRSLLTKLADTEDDNADVWEGLPGFQWYAPVLRARGAPDSRPAVPRGRWSERVRAPSPYPPLLATLRRSARTACRLP